MAEISVVMSVYKNDNAEDFRAAVESITVLQTRMPEEVIIIVDGPLPESLEEMVSSLVNRFPQIRAIYLPKNMGLGNALRIGLDSAKYDIIARMDADDISAPDRFEKQIQFLTENKDVDVVGGQITEFIDDESNIVGKRIVPCKPVEVDKYIKHRCPLNHMTIMGRKSKIIEAGNYLDLHFNEDYYLWIRMYEHGCRFANLPEALVNVRVGKEMYARRGGWDYFKSEKWLQGYMLSKHIIKLPRYCYNVFGRFCVQVLLPTAVRGFIFKTLFRKS